MTDDDMARTATRGTFGPRASDYAYRDRYDDRFADDDWAPPPRRADDWRRQKAEADAKERQNLETLIKALPDSEKTTFFFSFRKLKPAAGRGAGGGIQTNCGNYHPIGDDWKNTIKVELGQKYGPGFFEGTVRHQDGRTAEVKEKWTFFIHPDEAAGWGWRPDRKEDEPDQGGRGRGRNDAEGGSNDDHDPDKEARHAAWLEKRIETVKKEHKLKRTLDALENGEGDDDDDDRPRKRRRREADEMLAAERRAMQAEREAEIAKIRAEHEAALARIDAERAKERADLEKTTDAMKTRLDELAARLEQATKAPPVPPPTPAEVAREVKALMPAQPDPIEQMAKIKDLLPVPVQPERMDMAKTIEAVGKTFAPLMEALVSKLNQAPPPPPDPLEVLEKVKAFLPKKETDPLEMAKQVKEILAPPKQPDAFEMIEKVRGIVAPHKPPSKADLISEMQQLVALSGDIRGLTGRGGGGGDDDDDDDDDRPRAPATGLNSLDDVVKQIKTLEGLGIPVKIGGEQVGGTAQAIVAGIEKAVIAAGEAMAKAGVFNKGVDPTEAAMAQRERLIRARRAKANAQHLARQRQAMARRPMPPARAEQATDEELAEQAEQEAMMERQRRAAAERRRMAPPQPQPQPRPAPMPVDDDGEEVVDEVIPPRRGPAVSGTAGPQPQPQPPTEPAAPPADDGPPTSKEWGELCSYVDKAISDMTDPSDAAIHMLGQWPKATMMIAQAGNVKMIEVGLRSLATNQEIGAFAPVVQGLAGKLAAEPGHGWAELLIKNLS